MTDNAPQPPAPPSGGSGKIILAVLAAGAVAAGAMMLFKKGEAPAPAGAPGAPQASAPAVPAAPPPAPAPKRYSETIGDYEVPGFLGTVQLKGLRFTNASLTRAEIEAALKGDAALIGKLDAESIAADSATLKYTVGDQTTDTVYEGLEARDIKAGVIGRFTAKLTRTASTKGDKKLSEGTVEGITIERFDTPLLMRWLKEGDAEGKSALAPLHGNYTGGRFLLSVDGKQVDIAGFALSGSKVRPARRPVSSIIDSLRKTAEEAKAAEQAKDGAAKENAKAAEPDLPALLIDIVDLFDSFELGEGGFNGIKIRIPDSPSGPQQVDLARVFMAGGKGAHVGFDGLAATGNEGSFSLGKVDMAGDVTSLMLLGVQKAMRSGLKPEKPEKEQELRAYIDKRLAERKVPDIVFLMEALKGDFAASKGKANEGRMKFALGKLNITSGDFVGVTPTRIDYTLDKLDVPLDATSKDDAILALREMGMTQLGLDARISASWAEASQSLSLKEISVNVAQLARTAIASQIGNIPRAFFEDPQRNWPSAMGAAINSLTIDIDNQGGLAKLTDVMARRQGKSGEQMRKEFATIAPMLIAGVLAGHPDSGKVAQALANFINNLNGLKLKVTAAGPNGIVLTDLATAGNNPAEFAQKLRFEIDGK